MDNHFVYKLTKNQISLKKVLRNKTCQLCLKKTSKCVCNEKTGLNITNLTNLEVEDFELSLDYGQLELLSESEPEKVLSYLMKNNILKNNSITCLDITALIQLMNIFSKMKILPLGKTKCTVLDMLYNSKYFKYLNLLINVTILKDLISEIKLKEFYTNCKIVLDLITNPKSKVLLNEIVQSILAELNFLDIEKLKLYDNNLKTEKTLQIWEDLKFTETVTYVAKKWPQHYNDLSIYPIISDITSKKVILSPNITKGSYDNVKHYIDVQFRLIREDFVAPLREDICWYKTMNKTENKKMIPYGHIYFKAKIHKKKNSKESVHIVSFYTTEDFSIDSKRFMFESLLVFSNDNFNSMIFAQVNKFIWNKSPLKQLIIRFLGNFGTINLKSLYNMVESGTYFLPYMYTMDVLKTFNELNFPMKSYVVHSKSKPGVPKYLKCNSKMYNINGLQFDILNDKLWPDHQFLGLDYAQFMAFKAALTTEFTVIQGPPGTGKTFIGLKIVKSIIENMYETKILNSPIMVVCYTNHALDQFLEGILNITKNIKRIGGGSKSIILQNYIESSRSFEALKRSYVIGFTTTGAAMNHSSLLKLKPPIVIVEEAAEILESHVVVSLTKYCQHLILIGDHKQLRPRTATFTLSKQFDFDVSLFERMLKNGFPCFTLVTQHRMRPEISTLMLPIYPFLKDHSSVKNRQNIRGVSKNVYFIHHEIKEEKGTDSKSYKNMHEVNFFMELVRYFINQGYHQNQITILVTYREQLLEFQKVREKSRSLEYFRIECVDGYQGEENDIILLSLVRNNSYNNIGFLNIQNRICVALSRAKNGLYIMGNMDNLLHSSTWKKNCQTLLDKNSLGYYLTIHCEIHKDHIGTVCDSKDFAKACCLKVCNMKMDCGHRCLKRCHYRDQDHKSMYRCNKKYTIKLSCGFKMEIECWMKFLTYKCPQ